MPLDDDVRAYLEQLHGETPPEPWEVSLDAAREAIRTPHLERAQRTPVGAVRDASVPGPAGAIPVRIYTPAVPGPHPCVVWLHGGGFVLGDLDTHDEAARRACRSAEATVVSVDYRRAPEAPFPAAVEDSVAATRAVLDRADAWGIDADRVVVAGNSAGGNLAAVVARRLRDEEGPALAGQALIYPVTDLREATYPSRRENGEGYGLTQEAMDWFARQYVRSAEEAAHPDASPLLAHSLADLPPAFVLTAEYDPLRDEGDAYARRLAEEGVDVRHLQLHGTVHGVLTAEPPFRSTHAAWDALAQWLRMRFQVDAPSPS
ncbi:MAG: alpha/beta hydrolase [Trueperaceae bacterium]|nr:alpha/beta hydrolase [Trueperaceae bacterium]